MPRTRFDPKPQRNHLAELILGVAQVQHKTNADLAQMAGIAINTMSRRKKEPENLTVGELLGIGRGLQIPIDELRAAIRY